MHAKSRSVIPALAGVHFGEGGLELVLGVGLGLGDILVMGLGLGDVVALLDDLGGGGGGLVLALVDLDR